MRSLSSVVAAGVVVAGLLGAVPAQAEAGVPRCTNAMVQATYRGGDAATSHVFGRIVLRNTSARTCSLHGFGALSYVGGGNGTQVGAAADRVAGTAVRTVVLRPGEGARSMVVETSVGPYSVQDCRPRAVDGFRVYLPNATRSQFVAHPTTGCAIAATHLLTHQAFTGPRGPA